MGIKGAETVEMMTATGAMVGTGLAAGSFGGHSCFFQSQTLYPGSTPYRQRIQFLG